MHKPARHWILWLAPALLVTALAAGAFTLLTTRQHIPGEAGLRIRIGDLRSLAAEGALMTEEVSPPRATATWLHSYATDLGKNAESAGQKSEKPAKSPRLEPINRRAGELAADLGQSFEKLAALRVSESAPADSSRALHDDFARLFTELEKLEDSLKP